MQTVISFSSQTIKILQGSFDEKKGAFDIKTELSTPTPSGAIVNGIIIDKVPMLKSLLIIKQRLTVLKNVTVVIDSNYVLNRSVNFPKGNRKEYFKFVKNEFADKLDAEKTYIYDYLILEQRTAKKNVFPTLCCAVEELYVAEYENLFKEANIKLSRIDVYISSILNLISIIPKFDRKKSVVCVVDDYFVNILNFMEDGNVFLSKNRIISDKSHMDYFTETAERIYSHLQSVRATDRTLPDDNELTLYILDGNISSPPDYAEVLGDVGFTNRNNIIIGLNKAIGKTDNLIQNTTECYIYNLGMLI